MEKKYKEKNFISVVVYCYNDACIIKEFIENLHKTLSEIFLKFEIIIVNDCSTDNSSDIIKQYTTYNKERVVISLLNMSYFQGLEASMNAGVALSIGDFVFEFDSMNLDYDWSMLMKVYQHSLAGYDIVSAKVEGKPRLVSRIFYKLFNRYAHLQYKIGMESFRILSRRAINRIHSITQSIPFRKAAYANSGLAIDVLEYKPISKISRKPRKDSKSVAIDSLILFTDVAYRVTIGLAIIMLLLSVGIAIYALAYKLTENPVEGWTTTVIFNSLGFGGLFIILAMVIKYLQVIVKLNFRKKDFLFESIQKLQ